MRTVFRRHVHSALEKNRVLVHNIFGVVCLKGFSLLLSFVMTPMYLSYFHDQNILGVWYTLQSILVWVLTFDLGLGNGIRNRLATAISSGQKEEARKIVSSGYIMLALVTAGIAALMAAAVPLMDWQKLLNTTLEAQLLGKILLITLMGIVLQFFFSVISSILMALRKNIIANALPICTNLLLLAFLLLPHHQSDEKRFLILAIFYVTATLLPLVVASIVVFSTDLKEFRPSARYWDKNVGKSVLTIGGGFFIVQLGLLVINSTNQMIINYLFNGEAVVQYTLYYRLYSMAPMIFTLFTQPIWSEISVRYARKEIDWIQKIYHVMLGVAAVISLGCLAVTGLLPWIFKIWLGSTSGIVPSRMAGLIFTIWIVVELFVYASTCIANGMTRLRCQTIFTAAAAVLKIPVTLLCVRWSGAWTSVVWAHAIILLPLMVAQNVSLRRFFQEGKP